MIKKLLMGFCFLLGIQSVSFARNWTQEELEKEAVSWNKGMPQKLDEDTLFFNVEVKTLRLVFQHKILSMNMKKLTKEDVILLGKIPVILPYTICKETPFKEIYLDRGVSLTYSYYDNMGSALVDVTITKRTCDAIH